MEPFGGLLLPILRWPLQRRSTGAETFKVAKGSAKLRRATVKLYPGKTVAIRPKYKGVVSIRKVVVAQGSIGCVKLANGSKAFMLLAKKLGKTKVTLPTVSSGA